MFYLQANKTDLLRIQAAVWNTYKVIRKQAWTDLPFFMATDYKNNLVQNISIEKFANSYPKLNEYYSKWKIEKYGTTKFWHLKHDLVNAVTMWKEGVKWKAGIPAGILDSGGKSMFSEDAQPRYIGGYARANEFGATLRGGGKIPARPVFIPTLTEYKMSSQLKERINYAMSKIKAAWR